MDSERQEKGLDVPQAFWGLNHRSFPTNESTHVTGWVTEADTSWKGEGWCVWWSNLEPWCLDLERDIEGAQEEERDLVDGFDLGWERRTGTGEEDAHQLA